MDAQHDAYHSSSDSDFDDAASSAASSAADGPDKQPDADAGLEMGSGDEGIIAQGQRKTKKRKKGKKKNDNTENQDVVDYDGSADEDADGIRVRLRSGRGGTEAVKSKHFIDVTASTADIDAIWARMNDPKSKISPTLPPQIPMETHEAPIPVLKDALSAAPHSPHGTITIPHTYTFAGETHVSTKVIPANCPEAVAYLESQKSGKSDVPSSSDQGPTLRRPLARKGLLEPNPHVLVNGVSRPPRADLPASIGGNGARHLAAESKVSWDARKTKDVSLNTVEKSKLDWEREVERLGLREELEKAEKSGENYLNRREFLDRAEDARDQEARKWRLAAQPSPLV